MWDLQYPWAEKCFYSLLTCSQKKSESHTLLQRVPDQCAWNHHGFARMRIRKCIPGWVCTQNSHTLWMVSPLSCWLLVCSASPDMHPSGSRSLVCLLRLRGSAWTRGWGGGSLACDHGWSRLLGSSALLDGGCRVGAHLHLMNCNLGFQGDCLKVENMSY